ncbi:MAG: hypothetical protein WD992_02935 [Candidatus Levyibacteriota bacterium]
MPRTAIKQTMYGLFTGPNYKIQVGFENANTESPLKFSVSENLIDYGEITATDPVSRTNTISVSAPSSHGYTLQTFQDHSLKHNSSPTFIPDTTCDNGVCTQSIAQAWTGTLTYGFGYRCDPSTPLRTSTTNYCVSSFSDTNFYKPFSSEIPQIVAAASSESRSQITYKVNIPGSQAPEFYSNKITFIAVPNF